MINLYPDDESDAIRVKSGLQVAVKEDTDGKYIVLRRPTKKPIKDDMVIFTPPMIYDANGDELVTYKGPDGKNVYSYNKGDLKPDQIKQVGEQFNIGNDSLVKVRVSVYDTAMGKGHRLESIRVLDLIEYIADDDAGVEVEDEEVVEVKTKVPAKTPPKEEAAASNLPW